MPEETLADGYYWIRSPTEKYAHIAELSDGKWFYPGVSGSDPAEANIIVAGPVPRPDDAPVRETRVPPTDDLSLRVWLDDEFRKINARLDRAGIR